MADSASSVRSRVSLVLALTGVLFLVAVLLWALRTGKLGSEASVTVNQDTKLVSMNFDELSVADPINAQFTKVKEQYVAYGLRVTSQSYTVFNTVHEADIAAIALRLDLNNKPVPYASAPNAIVGAAGDWPTLSNPIILNFLDPADATKASTTGSVKFHLGLADAATSMNTVSLMTPTKGVKVTAYGKDGNQLTQRSYAAMGSHQVDLTVDGIARVVVETADQLPYVSGARFAIDDLSFIMPASSAAATLTTSKPEYTPGETVTGTLTNIGTKPLTCPKPLTFAIKSGTVTVVSAGQTSETQALAANASQMVTWDQKGSDGKQVPAGTYTLEVSCIGLTKTVTFVIKDPAVSTTPDATLTTSKPTYTTGESVPFTFTNTGSVDITCPTATPYVIQDAAGAAVFTPTGATVVETLAPAAARIWTWDQKKTDGTQAPDGTYVIVVNCGAIQRSVSFTLAATVPVSSVLDFTVVPTEGVAPLLVTASYTGTETGLTWDFGDGTVIPNAAATQTHVYPKAGTYTVTLRSGTKSGTKQVKVTAPSAPAPTPTPPTSTTKPTTSTSLTNATTSGPTLSNTTTKSSPATLVSTGGNLIVNLGIAAFLSVLIGYAILRRRGA